MSVTLFELRNLRLWVLSRLYPHICSGLARKSTLWQLSNCVGLNAFVHSQLVTTQFFSQQSHEFPTKEALGENCFSFPSSTKQSTALAEKAMHADAELHFSLSQSTSGISLSHIPWIKERKNGRLPNFPSVLFSLFHWGRFVSHNSHIFWRQQVLKFHSPSLRKT